MRFGGRVWDSDLERSPGSQRPREPDEDLHRLEQVGLLDPPGPARSCCCVAPAEKRVLLSVPDDPDRLIDLLLCGHHYRQHAQRLAMLNACILDADERAVRRPSAAVSAAPQS